ncbi:MAG: phage virion morphogenesis protein [Polyangiales bacterium]
MVTTNVRASGASVRAMIAAAERFTRPARLDALAAQMGAAVLATVSDAFASGRSPSGQTWAPLARRRGAPLVRSGALSRSFSVVTSAASVVLTSRSPYAATHQFGASMRRGRGRAVIPARPFLPDGRLPDSLRAALVRASRAFFGG